MDRQALKLVDLSPTRQPLPGAETERTTFPFGLGEDGVHEIAPASYGDTLAALGFALAAGARRAEEAIVWVREDTLERDRGWPCGDGLRQLGLDPGRILFVSARKRLEALWAVEEAMKSSAAGLVLGEIAGADFTATRRLSLAYETHGTPAILCLPHGLEGASASSARWRVQAMPSAVNRFAPRQLGDLRWQATLERARKAPHAIGRSHGLEFNHETLCLDLVPGLAAGQTPPQPQRETAEIIPLANTG